MIDRHLQVWVRILGPFLIRTYMINLEKYLALLKVGLMKSLEGQTQPAIDVFLMELSSFLQSQMSYHKDTHGPEKTKIIKAFFRGMKRCEPIK
jgi:hypothetical protein